MESATRRLFLSAAVGAVTAATGCLDGGDSSGDDGDLYGGDSSGTTVEDGFEFVTGAFEDGGTVPVRHTCDGEDVSPALSFDGLPDAAETLAVVVDDPDAGGFAHWLLWNVPADAGSIPGGIERADTVSELDGARQGTNGFDEVGYRGPCPPRGDDPHTYRFTAYAVETTLDLDPGAEKGELLDALDGPTLATARLTGEYGRS
ncbi:YbhB/YbcL family Raf kinase inhibitor-like protein [Halobacteriales archaeon QS_8_69_26]|nr:MAG: YbhB/YbcL family Raf kinase inhibitor-like protein [Halobacteriales archaeon QS_8_69_26]